MKAVSPGTATITATAENVSVTVKAKIIPVTGVSLYTVSVDYDFQLSLTRPTRPLWVTASGDVYFSIAAHDSSSYRLYKNGTMLYTSPFHHFNPICVTEPK